ncbi:MAG: AAA family ATPase [Vicinamibacterales bacterium]
MIRQIKRIENLGSVFADYQADLQCPDFKRINLIFGWNGSGKSTLSTLFDYLPGDKDGGAIEYDCELVSGERLRPRTPCAHPIRVFNQDYIAKNVNVVGGSANAITVILGEKNQELTKQIEEDQKLLFGSGTGTTKGLVSALETVQDNESQARKGRDKTFTDIARTIAATTSGTAARNYRKPDAQADFATISDADLLSSDVLLKTELQTKQSILDPIEAVELPSAGERNTPFPVWLVETHAKAQKLCREAVKAKPIERLSQDGELSDWVEKGVRLHEKHNSETCEYCCSQLTQSRVEQLAGHFSPADRNLKQEIDDANRQIRIVVDALEKTGLPSAKQFYAEFKDKADTAIDECRAEIEKTVRDLNRLEEQLVDKKEHTTTEIVLGDGATASALEDRLAVLTALINQHNQTTADFGLVRDSAATKVKKHYLATIRSEVADYDKTIASCSLRTQELTEKVDSAHKRIAESQAKISSTHKGCEELNRQLGLFLGSDELRFIPQAAGNSSTSELTGYQIARKGQTANRLSEGEKTAVALVYFVVHLGDGYFDTTNGIVVIDDPISSLDSSSMYQAFSVIKNAVKDARQVFILTHNFDFLKLLMNWCRSAFNNRSEYFLLKSISVAGIRKAHLGSMDSTLRSFDSEYHYLFKLLKEMRDDQDGTIAKAYPVPNIARKVWETFLLFQVPNADSGYKKIEVLKSEGVDAEKLDAIHKFVNDQSHLTGGGFDPALVPGVPKMIADMFEVMSVVAPRHFKILDEATS